MNIDQSANPPADAGEVWRPKLLLVDDDSLVRELMTEAMEHHGFHVTPADEADVALKFLDSGAVVDVMVTDYSMPEMNGLELIARVQASRPALPVILLTGFADEAVEKTLATLTGGKTMLLRKPVRPKELAARITALLT